MKKEQGINDTLNDIFLKILSGVDYGSKLAIETHKSIPVVHRQVEMLVDFGIVQKERHGKKVTYAVNWMNISDMLSSALRFDIEEFRRATNAEAVENKILNEIDQVLSGIPDSIFEENDEITEAAKVFLKNKKMTNLMEKFFRQIDKSKNKNLEFRNLSLDKSVGLFLDSLGMLSDAEYKKVLLKFSDKEKLELDVIFKLSRLKYLNKQRVDPRKNLFSDYLKE
ncbi:MAG: hypothetical protein V1859_07930 [archaeon]